MFSDRLIFEPCMQVRNSFYRCDSKFYIDDIIQMYAEDHKINGIVYTDGEICVWYTLINNTLKKVTNDSINLQNQFKNGGQSSNRLARNREIQRDQYLTNLAEKTVSLYYDKNSNTSQNDLLDKTKIIGNKQKVSNPNIK
jgi:peptide subunit release factor 1 (eRF1)